MDDHTSGFSELGQLAWRHSRVFEICSSAKRRPTHAYTHSPQLQAAKLLSTDPWVTARIRGSSILQDLMSQLSSKATLHLQLRRLDIPFASHHILPVVSNITTFALTVKGHFYTLYAKEILATVFASLTLPTLLAPDFVTDSYKSALSWPHSELLALSRRSRFDLHLHSIDFWHVCITQVLLLECLSELKSLRHLSISDSDHTPSSIA
ncbi:hypothetical protein C8J57DRAFT_1324506 [Mycena rebaudengoi]|nr:hypothetical protein C8J57DRAFT_1324506 [Mycena rebaudengoi]